MKTVSNKNKFINVHPPIGQEVSNRRRRHEAAGRKESQQKGEMYKHIQMNIGCINNNSSLCWGGIKTYYSKSIQGWAEVGLQLGVRKSLFLCYLLMYTGLSYICKLTLPHYANNEGK